METKVAAIIFFITTAICQRFTNNGINFETQRFEFTAGTFSIEELLDFPFLVAKTAVEQYIKKEEIGGSDDGPGGDIGRPRTSEMQTFMLDLGPTPTSHEQLNEEAILTLSQFDPSTFLTTEYCKFRLKSQNLWDLQIVSSSRSNSLLLRVMNKYAELITLFKIEGSDGFRCERKRLENLSNFNSYNMIYSNNVVFDDILIIGDYNQTPLLPSVYQISTDTFLYRNMTQYDPNIEKFRVIERLLRANHFVFADYRRYLCFVHGQGKLGIYKPKWILPERLLVYDSEFKFEHPTDIGDYNVTHIAAAWGNGVVVEVTVKDVKGKLEYTAKRSLIANNLSPSSSDISLINSIITIVANQNITFYDLKTLRQIHQETGYGYAVKSSNHNSYIQIRSGNFLLMTFPLETRNLRPTYVAENAIKAVKKKTKERVRVSQVLLVDTKEFSLISNQEHKLPEKFILIKFINLKEIFTEGKSKELESCLNLRIENLPKKHQVTEVLKLNHVKNSLFDKRGILIFRTTLIKPNFEAKLKISFYANITNVLDNQFQVMNVRVLDSKYIGYKSLNLNASVGDFTLLNRGLKIMIPVFLIFVYLLKILTCLILPFFDRIRQSRYIFSFVSLLLSMQTMFLLPFLRTTRSSLLGSILTNFNENYKKEIEWNILGLSYRQIKDLSLFHLKSADLHCFWFFNKLNLAIVVLYSFLLVLGIFAPKRDIFIHSRFAVLVTSLPSMLPEAILTLRVLYIEKIMKIDYYTLTWIFSVFVPVIFVLDLIISCRFTFRLSEGLKKVKICLDIDRNIIERNLMKLIPYEIIFSLLSSVSLGLFYAQNEVLQYSLAILFVMINAINSLTNDSDIARLKLLDFAQQAYQITLILISDQIHFNESSFWLINYLCLASLFLGLVLKLFIFAKRIQQIIRRAKDENLTLKEEEHRNLVLRKLEQHFEYKFRARYEEVKGIVKFISIFYFDL